MDEELVIAQDAWDKVVSLLGKPGHCRHVDRAVQSAVKSALQRQGVEAPGFAPYVGNQVHELCTSKVTPEGRTIAILAAGAAATVYTVMNYDEVEDMILDAARKAKIPIKIPIPSEYGTLTAKVGFESARAQWDIRSANGMRLKTYFEQPFDGGSPSLGLNASQQLRGGNMNLSAGINGDGQASVMFKLELKF